MTFCNDARPRSAPCGGILAGRLITLWLLFAAFGACAAPSVVSTTPPDGSGTAVPTDITVTLLKCSTRWR